MELFRSDNLLVRHVAGADPAAHVVTFDPWHYEETVDRPGFGEELFRSRGVTATHVLARGNDWYQYPELPNALAAIRAVTAGAARVMTYGSSMGAYAAIRFADAVGANAALALSPQYSVDPAKMAHEHRWGQVQRRLVFLEAVDGPVACAFRPVVVFDPRDADRLHAERLRADIAMTEIRVPYSGHPTATYLQEVGLLQDILFAVLDGTIDAAAVERSLRTRRAGSTLYHSVLAEAQPAWRSRTALDLARRAVALAPDSPLPHHFLALRLRAGGDLAAAIAEHAISLSHSRDVAFLYEYAKTLMEAGDLAAALALSREAEASLPWSGDLKHLTVLILIAQGDHAGARDLLRQMERLDPANRVYRRERRRAARRAAVARLKGLVGRR